MQRVCSSCSKKKELKEFVGGGTTCRDCRNAKTREHNARYASLSADQRNVPQAKVCCVCKKKRRITAFGRNRSTPDGYQYRCKPCAVVQVSSSYQRHPAARKARNEKYYRGPLKAAKNRRRRARLSGATVNDFTADQWVAMQEHYEHCCVYCKRQHRGELTQDHLTPLSKGGAHTASNIVPACAPCNRHKNAGAVLAPVQPLLFAI